MIRLIAAVDQQMGIGKDGGIPWKIPIDEKYFTDQTKTHGAHVLTGSKTYHETYHGPLKDRHNYVLSHDSTPIEGVEVVTDLAEFLDRFKDGDLWIAGGAGVFEELIKLGKADELYLTFIDDDFSCDRFFPKFGDDFKEVESSDWQEQNGFRFRFAKFAKV